jgi:hypothetical protein
VLFSAASQISDGAGKVVKQCQDLGAQFQKLWGEALKKEDEVSKITENLIGKQIKALHNIQKEINVKVDECYAALIKVFSCGHMPHIWLTYCAVAKHNNTTYRPRSASDASTPSVFTADSIPRVYFFPNITSLVTDFGAFIKLLLLKSPVIVRIASLNNAGEHAKAAACAALDRMKGSNSLLNVVINLAKNLINSLNLKVPSMFSLFSEDMKAGQKYALTTPVEILPTAVQTGLAAKYACRDLHHAIAWKKGGIEQQLVKAFDHFLAQLTDQVNSYIGAKDFIPKASFDLSKFSAMDTVDFVHYRKDTPLSIDNVSKYIGKQMRFGWKTISYHNVLRNDIYWSSLTFSVEDREWLWDKMKDMGHAIHDGFWSGMDFLNHGFHSGMQSMNHGFHSGMQSMNRGFKFGMDFFKNMNH